MIADIDQDGDNELVAVDQFGIFVWGDPYRILYVFICTPCNRPDKLPIEGVSYFDAGFTRSPASVDQESRVSNIRHGSL